MWERWVRVNGPAAFLAHFSQYGGVAIPRTDHPGIHLLLSQAETPMKVALEIMKGQHPSTASAFFRFPVTFGLTKNDIALFYIRGRKYPVIGREKILRIADMFLAYATCGVEFQ